MSQFNSKPVIGIGSDILPIEGERDRAFVYTTYVDAVRRAGAVPLIIPPQPENAGQLLDLLDGVLLAGGDDCDPSLYGEVRHPSVEPMNPSRQENDLTLARLARERGIPTLGICLGAQVMNVAAGGTLIQDIDSQIDTNIQHASIPENRARHDVKIDGESRLAGIVGEQEVNVNSSHHQAIGRVGSGLRTSAHAPDGVVEGVEDPRHPFYLGVQWHPEDMKGDVAAARLFDAFVDAARMRAQQAEEVGGGRSVIRGKA